MGFPRQSHFDSPKNKCYCYSGACGNSLIGLDAVLVGFPSCFLKISSRIITWIRSNLLLTCMPQRTRTLKVKLYELKGAARVFNSKASCKKGPGVDHISQPLWRHTLRYQGNNKKLTAKIDSLKPTGILERTLISLLNRPCNQQ